MTRVNHRINPKELCDQMLLAEWKELLDVFRHACNRSMVKKPGKIPDEFKLDKGHALYFVNKGAYIIGRQKCLYAELEHRGFSPSFSLIYRLQNDWPKQLRNAGWVEPEPSRCRKLLIERIQQQLLKMKRKPTWTNRTRPKWARVN